MLLEFPSETWAELVHQRAGIASLLDDFKTDLLILSKVPMFPGVLARVSVSPEDDGYDLHAETDLMLVETTGLSGIQPLHFPYFTNCGIISSNRAAKMSS